MVTALIPPTIYYSKVGVELAKMVAKDQKMALPYVLVSSGTLPNHANTNHRLKRRSTETFTSAYRSAWQSIQSGTATQRLGSIRNMSTAQMVGVGIVGAELIGFFSVGEILGRFKLVGYRGGKSEEHH